LALKLHEESRRSSIYNKRARARATKREHGGEEYVELQVVLAVVSSLVMFMLVSASTSGFNISLSLLKAFTTCSAQRLHAGSLSLSMLHLYQRLDALWYFCCKRRSSPLAVQR
jgi:hypothetical protein